MDSSSEMPSSIGCRKYTRRTWAGVKSSIDLTSVPINPYRLSTPLLPLTGGILSRLQLYFFLWFRRRGRRNKLWARSLFFFCFCGVGWMNEMKMNESGRSTKWMWVFVVSPRGNVSRTCQCCVGVRVGTNGLGKEEKRTNAVRSRFSFEVLLRVRFFSFFLFHFASLLLSRMVVHTVLFVVDEWSLVYTRQDMVGLQRDGI